MSEQGGQYFSSDPAAAHRPRTVVLALPDARFELATDAGVFSGDGVDRGTRTLLLEAPTPPQGPVVLADVGCGYGPIALTLARRSPAATIWAVDVNARARDLCRANAEAAGFGDRVRVVAPDEVPDDLVVAGFWSNPPIRIGKAELHGLLGGWFARLGPGGEAMLVVHRHLGADSLTTWIADEGLDVERLVSRGGYRILRAVNPVPRPSDPGVEP
jgi:16S rRNA (guanine1207-N2)-methyltransferase